MANDPADRDPPRDDQIIALLQEVGQRLILSERERKEFRRVVDDLAEKADQGERAYLTLQDRLNKTESFIEKRQKALEKIQKDQVERIERITQMADKIELAIANHSRIDRRLEKIVQDKARMIRKLERIEEAVIETQDAINTRALVPANDPAAGQSAGAEAKSDYPWWKQPTSVRAAAVSAMILLGVAGGWAMSKFDLPAGAWQMAGDGQEAQTQTADAQPQAAPSFDNLAAYNTPAQEQEKFAAAVEQVLNETASDIYDAPQDQQAADPALMPAEAAVATAEPMEETAPQAAEDMSDEQLLASLEQDPDKLAAQLNEIAPVAGNPMPEELDEAAPVPAPEQKAEEAPKVEKAALTPQKEVKEAREQTTAEFLKVQEAADKRPLRERIAADPSLPPVIQEVEKKAFEGVKEAQHDLAAIYTAGHGGVAVNYEKAAQWFRESALAGVANASYNLGVLYHQGLGVEKDINTAVKWYRAAADAGHPEAQYNLGIAYIEGIGTRYNPDKAAYYFEQAASKGILEAAYNLGLIHENGLTGKSQPDEALYWYKQAADMGSPEAKIAMDQLAKTLGLMPEDIERMYGERKEQKRTEAAPAPQTQPAGKTAQARQQQEQGVEYLEAQPLEAADTPPRLVTIEENDNKAINEDQAVVAQIQEQLIRLGLYPGPADGVNDSLTGDAIRAYQAQNDLKQDGRASQALLVHMMTTDMGSTNEYGSRAE